MSAWDSVKKAIIGVAPVLGGVIGGPLGGVAAATLSNIILGKPDGSPDELLGKLKNPSHEMYAKLKEAEIAYEELCIKKSAQDMLDVREKAENALKLTGKRDPVRTFLAVGMAVGFFAVLAGVFLLPINPDAKTIIDVMLGALLGRLDSVYNYFFGSSYGSSRKTDILASEQQKSGLIGLLIDKITK